MSLTQDEIQEWANSGSAAKRIAADLATMITTGRLERFANLPDREELASTWNVSVETITRAKRLLADYGLVKLTQDRNYYVA